MLALVYAWVFEHVTHRAGWIVGAGLGLVHAVISGLGMTIVPLIHPMIPERLPAPGAFMANLGVIGIVAEFALHAVYGAVVGGLYGPVLRERARQPEVA